MKLYVMLFSLLGTWTDRVDTRDETGATAVEYGLMVALIAVVIIVAVTGLGRSVSNKFVEIANAINNAGN